MEKTGRSLLLLGGATVVGVGVFAWSRRSKAATTDESAPETKTYGVGALQKLPKKEDTEPPPRQPTGGEGTSLEFGESYIKKVLAAIRDGEAPVLAPFYGWEGLAEAVAASWKQETGKDIPVDGDLISKVKKAAKTLDSGIVATVDARMKDFERVFTKKWSKPGADKTFKSALQAQLTKDHRKEDWGSANGMLQQTSGVVADAIKAWAKKIIEEGYPLAHVNRVALKEGFHLCRGKKGADFYRCLVTDLILKQGLGMQGPVGKYGDLSDDLRNKMIMGERAGGVKYDQTSKVRKWFLRPMIRDNWQDKKLWSSVTPAQRKRVFDTAVYFWPTLLAYQIRNGDI